MLVIPQDIPLLGLVLIIPAIFEILRIIIGFLLAGPSGRLQTLEKDKIIAMIELRSIKSVQLELVRNAKLERRIIKIDKEIEQLTKQQTPKVEKTRKMLRYLRMVVYVALMAYFFNSNVPLYTSPQIFWPFSWVSSERTMPVHAWLLVPLSGAATRHVLRTILPLIFSTTTLP
eukprot:gene29706-35861_t